MIDYDFDQVTPFEVERLFGKGFTDELFSLETGVWQGPIGSSYGLHLVRISDKVNARNPEFSSVIDKVKTDWMFEHRQKMNNEMFEMFKKRYEIIVEDMPEKSGMAIASRLQRGTS